MRWMLLSLGWLFAGFALAGLVLPLLPCTPFALLSAACFGRSSPAARRWLYRSRWLGPVLEDWRRHRGFRRATKFRLAAIALVASAISLAAQPSTATMILSLAFTGAAMLAILLFRTVDDLAPNRPAVNGRPRRSVGQTAFRGNAM